MTFLVAVLTKELGGERSSLPSGQKGVRTATRKVNNDRKTLMPPIEQVDPREVAVLWTPKANPNAYGRLIYNSPVEITVGWQTKRRQAINARGETVTLDASAAVNQVIPIGSVLYLGLLSDYMGSAGGVDRSELLEVVTYDGTPDLNDRLTQRNIGMMKYRETAPPLV